MRKNIFIIIAILSLLAISILDFQNRSQTPELLEVHFIDIGQGDSILIRTPNGKNMLIDSGSNEKSDKLLSYLHMHQIKKLDVVIATHPDEDHIGAMSKIVENFDISSFYMPNKTHNTESFYTLITKLKEKNISVYPPRFGDIIPFDKSMKLLVLNPNDDVYSDNNNYSIVVKLIYGYNSFLFTGDIDSEKENDLIKAFGNTLDSDVLKLAHHGSSSSCSKEFLETVSPLSAVASAGVNNPYNHPGEEVCLRLQEMGIPLYRTDEQGDIIFYSDSNKITVNLPNAGSYD